MSETTTEKLLPYVQWNNHKSGSTEEKLAYKEIPEENLINKDLVERIEILENGQAYQMVQI